LYIDELKSSSRCFFSEGKNMKPEEVLELIQTRRSIRQFEDKQIEPQKVEQILQAGLYAPSAGSRQSPIFMVMQDEAEIETLGKINRQAMKISNARNVNTAQPSILDDPSLVSGFYGAPCVIAILAPKNFKYAKEDAACAAENMLLMAHALDLGGCIVARADQSFESEYGKELLKKRGIDEDYEGVLFVLFGYPKGKTFCKPRKERIF
jgi:nitroreductase